MNVWIGEGRLVRDPEIKVVGGGIELCKFTVACDRKKGKDGEKKADFIDCTAFGKKGAFIEKYFRKGDGIAIVGRFESDTYDAKDGTKRTKWGVMVDDIHFPIGKRNASEAVSDANQFEEVSIADCPF